jgi:hypothetical protein
METSRALDFAILSNIIPTAPKEYDAHTLTIDPVEMSSDMFDSIFYSRRDRRFSLNPIQETNQYLTLENKTINDASFNLVSRIISFYEQDIGITYHNWEFESIIKLKKLLQQLRSVYNFYRYANAVSRRELLQSIIDEGGIINGINIHVLRLQLLIKNIDTRFRDIRIILQYHVPLKIITTIIPNDLFLLSQLIQNYIYPYFTKPFLDNDLAIVRTNLDDPDKYLKTVDSLFKLPDTEFKLLAFQTLGVVQRAIIIYTENTAMAARIRYLEEELKRKKGMFLNSFLTKVVTVEVQIDVIYIYYLREYGKPIGGVFDPLKLAILRDKYSAT